jgi:catechol 2,3-dioxygenase-like lactoylglutathione lyase family enzyme
MKLIRLLVAVSPVVLMAQTPATPVIGLGNLAHTAETLEKTVPFYRDLLGLPMNGNGTLGQPQALNELMSAFTGTKGMSFRAATFRIPNANFGFELTEFSGAERKPGQPHLYDPGMPTLALQVRDIEKMMAKMKAANVAVLTIGGEPLNPTGNPSSKMREVIVKDPDGFYVELQQPDPLPASAATTQGDILGASIQLAVDDMDILVKFYKDALGFVARPGGAWVTNETVGKIIGLPSTQWRITHGSIPGTTLDWGLIEYKRPDRRRLNMGAQDPGSPAFTMVVRDIDAAIAQWKAAGGSVASTGGVAAKQPNGQANVFVRDPNGLLWEMYTRPAAPAGKQAK